MIPALWSKADPPLDTRLPRQVLANVEAVLTSCGSGIDQLVQVRVYVDDIANWPEFDALYAQWAGAGRPARAVVPTAALHFGCKIEVEAMALASAARP